LCLECVAANIPFEDLDASRGRRIDFHFDEIVPVRADDPKRAALQNATRDREVGLAAGSESVNDVLTGGGFELHTRGQEPDESDAIDVGRHPAARDIDFDDARSVGWRLAELLPIEPEIKQSLLQLQFPRERLQELTRLVNKLRG